MDLEKQKDYFRKAESGGVILARPAQAGSGRSPFRVTEARD